MAVYNKKAQSVLEYGLVITAVIAAFLAINIYLKKAVQGKLKESSDQIGRRFKPEKFTTAWEIKPSTGVPQTTTTEKRNIGDDGQPKTRTPGQILSGETTTETTEAETITRSEYETFGAEGKVPALYEEYKQ